MGVQCEPLGQSPLWYSVNLSSKPISEAHNIFFQEAVCDASILTIKQVYVECTIQFIN